MMTVLYIFSENYELRPCLGGGGGRENSLDFNKVVTIFGMNNINIRIALKPGVQTRKR